MKKVTTVLSVCLLILSCGSKTVSNTNSSQTITPVKNTTNPVEYAETITEKELREKLTIYASDEFEGRETGEPGQKKAVEYLKNHYINLNIPSPLGGTDYFQEVPLAINKSPEISLSVNGQEFKQFDDFLSLTAGNSQVIEKDHIVYLGYGIESENYTDYNLNVENKIVLVKSGEPKNDDGTFKVTGTTEASKWSNARQELAAKRNAAKNAGAKAIIIINQELFTPYSNYFRKQAESGKGGRISLKGDNTIYALLASNNFGKALLDDIESNNTSSVINRDFKMNYKSNAQDVDSENVVAFIKGSEKPNEIIVLSAHLDHEGVKDGKIYNGADDDGSGTVAIMEIAEAFKQALDKGHGPKRSILFLHVTGEEKGLLGSRHYTDNNPIFPLENTVANLNIDMIGRIDPKRTEGDRNYIYLIGSDKLSTELHNLSEEINNKYTNIELDYRFNDDNDPNRFYYRSDHYNFAKNNIPIIFYFNGTHADYHQPSDTVEKINFDLLQNRTRLIFYTAWEVANRDKRLIVDKAESSSRN